MLVVLSVSGVTPACFDNTPLLQASFFYGENLKELAEKSRFRWSQASRKKAVENEKGA
jgi:hypothetical protein